MLRQAQARSVVVAPRCTGRVGLVSFRRQATASAAFNYGGPSQVAVGVALSRSLQGAGMAQQQADEVVIVVDAVVRPVQSAIDDLAVEIKRDLGTLKDEMKSVKDSMTDLATMVESQKNTTNRAGALLAIAVVLGPSAVGGIIASEGFKEIIKALAKKVAGL